MNKPPIDTIDWPPESHCGNCGWWKADKLSWVDWIFMAKPRFGRCTNPRSVEFPVSYPPTHKHYVCRFHTDSGRKDISGSLACFERACERLGMNRLIEGNDRGD